jgi:hypothetical protein
MKKAFGAIFALLLFSSTLAAAASDINFFEGRKAASSLFLIVLVAVYYTILYVISRVTGKSDLPDNEPPYGVSAAEVYYIDSYKEPKPARACALFTVSLIVKWAVRVNVSGDGVYTLRIINKEAPLLSAEEKGVISDLFKKENTYSIGSADCKSMAAVFRKTVRTILGKTEHIFKNDFLYSIPILFIFAFYLAKVFLIPFLIALAFMAFMGIMLLNIRRPGVKGGIILGFCIAGLFGIFTAGALTPAYLLFVAAFLVMTMFVSVLKSYSCEGERIMEHLNSFKDYLSGKEAADANNNLFCDYLPYAIAFKKEKEWAEYCKHSLSTSAGKKALKERGLGVFLEGEDEEFSLDKFIQACEESLKKCF